MVLNGHVFHVYSARGSLCINRDADAVISRDFCITNNGGSTHDSMKIGIHQLLLFQYIRHAKMFHFYASLPLASHI